VNNYLKTLERGARVYVEANFELREPDASADPNTPQGQRQIFLRHGVCPVSANTNFRLMIISETIRVIGTRPHRQSTPQETTESQAHEE
jgi:hypothetical protein